MNKNKRILIVDDEPFNLNSLMILIELCSKDLGVDFQYLSSLIDTAKDGFEAFEKVQS